MVHFTTFFSPYLFLPGRACPMGVALDLTVFVCSTSQCVLASPLATPAPTVLSEKVLHNGRQSLYPSSIIYMLHPSLWPGRRFTSGRKIIFGKKSANIERKTRKPGSNYQYIRLKYMSGTRWFTITT
ncbi:hypothetical protein F4810DRAFT_405477 [Camillea tinctor]|nr:hypothetical protein F4810DRAFT_405477 [Camillea tinctor]